MNKCERCKRKGKDVVHVVDYGNWNFPQRKGSAIICDACNDIWTKRFIKNFGESVSLDKYDKCRQLFKDFISRKPQVFVFR